MKLLAIDTAANLCAACVFDTGSQTAPVAETLDIGKGHVECLMPLIGRVLDRAGAVYGDLDRIAVSIGPGSFTGVRVGVAAARGFSLALEIPAVGISCLDALAAETREQCPGREVVVAIDARREEIYTARYSANGSVVCAPEVSMISGLAGRLGARPLALAGSAARMVGDASGHSDITYGPLAATASIETYAMLGAAADVSGEAPVPLYLRSPDAKPQQGFAVARVGRQ